MSDLTRKSVSTVIYEFLQEHYPEWHAGYEFVNRSVVIGGKTYWLGSSSDRKCRLMSERGIIERKHEKGYAWYRAIKKPVLSEISNVKQMAFDKELW